MKSQRSQRAAMRARENRVAQDSGRAALRHRDYGNIGAPDRLDFTVIGLSVNLVSRIEAVAKSLDLPLVVSDAAQGFMLDRVHRSQRLVRRRHSRS